METIPKDHVRCFKIFEDAIKRFCEVILNRKNCIKYIQQFHQYNYKLYDKGSPRQLQLDEWLYHIVYENNSSAIPAREIKFNPFTKRSTIFTQCISTNKIECLQNCIKIKIIRQLWCNLIHLYTHTHAHTHTHSKRKLEK